MAKTVTVEEANKYFATEVLHNAEWEKADASQRERALTNAENQLYQFYTSYNTETKPLDKRAVYEQALWLLRMDDSIRKAEQGVRNVNVKGISVSTDRPASVISPAVKQLLGRRIGRAVL